MNMEFIKVALTFNVYCYGDGYGYINGCGNAYGNAYGNGNGNGNGYGYSYNDGYGNGHGNTILDSFGFLRYATEEKERFKDSNKKTLLTN